jgi:hypothetical protein
LIPELVIHAHARTHARTHTRKHTRTRTHTHLRADTHIRARRRAYSSPGFPRSALRLSTSYFSLLCAYTRILAFYRYVFRYSRHPCRQLGTGADPKQRSGRVRETRTLPLLCVCTRAVVCVRVGVCAHAYSKRCHIHHPVSVGALASRPCAHARASSRLLALG